VKFYFRTSLKGNSVDFVDQMTERRFIKTHLPWHLLPNELQLNENTKIIYTMRNPKDLAVSFYHYCLLAHRINCSFDEYLNLFLENNWAYGSVSKHMTEFYKRRNNSNILIVRYEEMKQDLPGVIKKCAEHLEIDYELTSNDIEKICNYVKFENMEKNKSVNLETIIFKDPIEKENVDQNMYNKVKFIRKGQVGDWQNHFSSEINEKFDDWIAENFDSSELTFEYA
jgi:Sulfotransferase domain